MRTLLIFTQRATTTHLMQTKLTYPLETGNPKTNALIKKKIVYERSLASLRQAVKSGLIVKSTTILGFPFHTFRDVLKEYLFTVRLA